MDKLHVSRTALVSVHKARDGSIGWPGRDTNQEKRSGVHATAGSSECATTLYNELESKPSRIRAKGT